MANVLEGGLSTRVLIDSIPFPVFVVTAEVEIVDCNAAGARMLGDVSERELLRCGEVLECVNAVVHRDSCGRMPACSGCAVRGAVRQAASEHAVIRRRARLEVRKHGALVPLHLLVTAGPVSDDLVLLLVEDVGTIAQLLGIVPVCSWCRKIRGEEGTWDTLELFFKKRLDLDVSHDLCPDCYRREFAKIGK